MTPLRRLGVKLLNGVWLRVGIGYCSIFVCFPVLLTGFVGLQAAVGGSNRLFYHNSSRSYSDWQTTSMIPSELISQFSKVTSQV